MIAYGDSRALVPFVIQLLRLPDWWSAYATVITSELTSVELRRVAYRLRATGQIADARLSETIREIVRFEGAVNIIALEREVLLRAGGPMPTAIKTLDAIHIATADLYREEHPDLVFVTADRQQSLCAAALGLEVLLVGVS